MHRANPIPLLRNVAIAEAISFLILLFVAMPLKHFAGVPAAVKVVGWLHGLLFMAFVVVLVYTTIVARWPLARAGVLFVAALLPSGPFVMDRRMKQYAAEFAAGAAGS
jgi:integral membrane protein